MKTIKSLLLAILLIAITSHLSYQNARAEITLTVRISDDGVPVEGLGQVHYHILDWELGLITAGQMVETNPGVYRVTLDEWTDWVYWNVQIDDQGIVPHVPSQNPAPNRQIWGSPRGFDWDVEDNR